MKCIKRITLVQCCFIIYLFFTFSGRFYYWDVVNDSVTWLPPSHPRSIVTDSVAQFRFERHAIMQNMDKKASDSEVN